MTNSVSLLGPFVGHTTDTSTVIWIRHKDLKTAVIVISSDDPTDLHQQEVHFEQENLWTATARFENLRPDTLYSYQILKSNEDRETIDLEGLHPTDLKVRTMPRTFDSQRYRYDFLLMSCHNPDKVADPKKNKDGYEIWNTLPTILKAHETKVTESRVLFALLGGDQIYADDWRQRLLSSSSVEEKISVYLEVYEHYWSDNKYRRVLASLPAYLMWDDHDIMDGWGSELSSFEKTEAGLGTEFKPEWKSMFIAASRAFQFYQAARNPSPLISNSFDLAFTVGPIGFIMADLRSHRNWQKRQFWTDEQFIKVHDWINANKQNIDVLFFLTPVVIAHGSPLVEEGLVKNWDLVVKFFNHVKDAQKAITQKGLFPLRVVIGIALLASIVSYTYCLIFADQVWIRIVAGVLPFVLTLLIVIYSRSIQRKTLLFQINLIRADQGQKTLLGWILHLIGLMIPNDKLESFDNNVGDLSDDIRDSWGGDGNERSVERLLNLLFDLQNDENSDNRVHVAVLSGDIHAGGYSNIYSSKIEHQLRPTIPHIVSSPVGYSPFPWFAEAFYRKFSIGAVPLGTSNTFYAQNSHYFTERNIAICSIRRTPDTLFLKSKFYIEGYPEPQTSLFDLEKTSHRESIAWTQSQS